jgi:signal peptidase II
MNNDLPSAPSALSAVKKGVRGPRLLFWLNLAGWLIADLATKQLALLHLRHHLPIVVIPGWFDLAYAQNTGVAFSLLNEHPTLLIFLTLGLLGYLAWTSRQLDWSRRVVQIACAMVAAGAVGNLFDRITRGSVIDFISVHWQNKYYWPTFNIADIGICVGLGLLLFFGGLNKSAHPAPVPASGPDDTR